MPDYTNPSKQTWRGWSWNRIAERIPKADRRSAVGLYLAGPHDLDRAAARSKGFRDYNLIAVDIDKDCVQGVRDQGFLAIQDRLEDLVAVWPGDWPLSFIHADLTCGLAQAAKELQAALILSQAVQMGSTVIAVNLQRGRDADSNPVRAGISQAMADPRRRDWMQRQSKQSRIYSRVADMVTDSTHRGKQLMSVFLFHCRQSVGHTGMAHDAYVTAFMKQANPQFYSYRQDPRTPYMDSVVFTMPNGERGELAEMLPVYVDMAKRDPLKVKPKIAACRAMRTMRMRA